MWQNKSAYRIVTRPPVFRPRTRLRPSRLLTIAHREKCVAYDEQNLEALADVFHSLPVQHERHRISSHDVDVSFLEREINLSLWLRSRPRGAGYACTVGWLKLREVLWKTDGRSWNVSRYFSESVCLEATPFAARACDAGELKQRRTAGQG